MDNNIKIIRKPIAIHDFHSLCRSVGWQEVNPESYAVAISNSIACVHAVKGQQIVGFARLIGDQRTYPTKFI